MNIKHLSLSFLIVLMSMLMLQSCQQQYDCSKVVSKRANNDDVIEHELADPDRLNPVTSVSAGANYIENNIFMYLLDVDREKLEMTPSLAIKRPEITPIEDGEYKGGMKLVYEIRPEATWDNGTPVTANDVVFTYKAIKNPLVNSEQLRPYIDFVTDVVIDKENPKKFTIYTKKRYFAMEVTTGEQAYIIPEYVYDPQSVMRKFNLKDFDDTVFAQKLRANADNIAFAKEFNSEKYQRDHGFVVGCGPYEFSEWTTKQRIILKRKANWWGDKVVNKSPIFAAKPSKITYEIINDWTTAVTAMKDENIDVMYNTQPKQFQDLQKNEAFKCKFNLYKPAQLQYVYIGMNMKNEKLADVKVREAIAHLVDRQQIISVLLYGNAIPMYGPVNPQKKYCDTTITKYEFDIEKAKKLLDEAGWKDSDGDGIRDKIINGQKVQLSLTYKYNSGNDTREKIGTFLKENAQKVGINIELVVKEWTVFLEENKHHDIELYCGGWVPDPILDDPKQIWHTTSYNDGSNYVGYGDEETDATIDSLRQEMDPIKVTTFYKRFQQQINQRIPYVFLYSPTNRLVISKRFATAKPNTVYPGVVERSLEITK